MVKKFLFDDNDSLFQKLKNIGKKINVTREIVASNMLESEIHQDINDFFNFLKS